MNATTAGVMQRLKDATADLHTAAERSDFQQIMIAGRMPRAGYVRFLEQMLLVHAALERGMRGHAAAQPAIAQVVKDYQYQEPYLLCDLAYFGVDPASVAPLTSTSRLLEHIAECATQRPLSLLGFHYVLEGSNNGSRFIARSVQRALALEPGRGVTYLDPYGDALHARWAQFKTDMNAATFSEADAAQIVVAAQAMFVGITSIGEELLAVLEIAVPPDVRAAAAAAMGGSHAQGGGHHHHCHAEAAAAR